MKAEKMMDRWKEELAEKSMEQKDEGKTQEEFQVFYPIA